MGACDFYQVSTGKSAREAFDNATSEARYDYGHAGYTGTLAEKTSFVMITLPEGRDAQDYAEELVMEGDRRVDDKWGPAGCIALGNDRYLFFGWASS